MAKSKAKLVTKRAHSPQSQAANWLIEAEKVAEFIGRDKFGWPSSLSFSEAVIYELKRLDRPPSVLIVRTEKPPLSHKSVLVKLREIRDWLKGLFE